MRGVGGTVGVDGGWGRWDFDPERECSCQREAGMLAEGRHCRPLPATHG